MLIKIHKAYRLVVAVCDSEILGRNLEEGNAALNIKDSFFGGENIEEAELIAQMKDLAKEDATFNIVGTKSVNCALKAGIISLKGVRTIQDVPFALVLL